MDGYPAERPLVLGGSLEPGTAKSTLFLAEPQGVSQPSNEVFGLVKLTDEEVTEIARNPHTFGKIEATAKPQDTQSKIASGTPLVISSHLQALAYCLECGTYSPDWTPWEDNAGLNTSASGEPVRAEHS